MLEPSYIVVKPFISLNTLQVSVKRIWLLPIPSARCRIVCRFFSTKQFQTPIFSSTFFLRKIFKIFFWTIINLGANYPKKNLLEWNWVFITNSNFLIYNSLQPDGCLIFQTYTFSSHRIHSLKYLRFALLGFKDIFILKSV